uniref:Vesicle transport v-SNARE N-terminal domain-containing protein n=1 Tax=Amphora coffeiformis TaxID=265554 RepID=A0A7S3P7W6_9STRA|mmetsp:Transcript_11695/g.22414  ORF Transcript_11695/g.22414 Transcript_11695/m.22414 type:complete len:204 (+) Transcript_11695:153-764(+)
MTDYSRINFDQYDEEFSNIAGQVQKSLQEEPPSQYTTGLLQQCDDLIQQMDLEARTVPDATLKRNLIQKVRTCKAEYQRLRQESERQGLLGGRRGQQSENERLMLQKNEDMLGAQNDTLERARRTMQDTEAVALEITEELGQNREKLISAHGRVREVSGLTGRARRILTSMSQRAVQQKMILYAVAIGLCLTFFILVWGLWHR